MYAIAMRLSGIGKICVYLFSLHFLSLLSCFQNFMRASREDMRTSAAQLYAIVANCHDTKKMVEIVEELTRNTKDQVGYTSLENNCKF